MTERESPPRPRAGYHHGDLRAAMLRATEQMVADLGPEAVSVREVARRAGVSSGAPFHHFPTRRALMTALAEEATHRLRQRLEDAVAKVRETRPRKRLRAMGRAYLGWVVDNPAQFKIVSDRRLIDYTESIQRDNAAVQVLMRETLLRAIRQADAPELDIDQAMLQMRAMAYGLARMFVDGHLPQWGVTDAEPLGQLAATLDTLVRHLVGGKAV
jgi:AcrR family transcriptional regulator